MPTDSLDLILILSWVFEMNKEINQKFRVQPRFETLIPLVEVLSVSGSSFDCECFNIGKNGLCIKTQELVKTENEFSLNLGENKIDLIGCWASKSEDQFFLGLKTVEEDLDLVELFREHNLIPENMETKNTPVLDLEKARMHFSSMAEDESILGREDLKGERDSFHAFSVELNYKLGLLMPKEVTLKDADKMTTSESRKQLTVLVRCGIEWVRVWPLTLEEDERVLATTKVNRTLGESVNHVKGTLKYIDIINKDPKRIDAIQNIGQKFNGLMGTYWNFYQGRPGLDQVYFIAIMIDEICRTYDDGEIETIDPDHVDLVTRGCNLLFNILMDVKKGSKVFSSEYKELAAIKKKYKKMENIKRRDSLSQSKVDELMDMLDKGEEVS